MSKRREFTKPVRVKIIKRATVGGVVRCEKCAAAVTRFEVHHLEEDALQLDKSEKLTAEQGQLLCEPCHAELTKAFAPIIAKARRREARHLGARVAPVKPLEGAGFAISAKTAKRLAREPRQALPPRPLFR